MSTPVSITERILSSVRLVFYRRRGSSGHCNNNSNSSSNRTAHLRLSCTRLQLAIRCYPVQRRFYERLSPQQRPQDHRQLLTHPRSSNHQVGQSAFYFIRFRPKKYNSNSFFCFYQKKKGLRKK